MNFYDEFCLQLQKDDEDTLDVSMEIIIALHQAVTVKEKVNARKETLISKYLKSLGVLTKTDPQKKQNQY